MDCDKGPLRHKHHIIPRHMGGSDYKNNLVEVSITQHAMFHYCNYRLWSKNEDRVAWLGLSGQIGKDDIIIEIQKIAVELARTPEARKKQKEKLAEIEHNKGAKNSQYGKMWITNGTKEGTYRINRGEQIPKGYRPGRISINEKKISYTFKIITPSGKIVNTKNLYQFCFENDLIYSVMLRVSKGQRNHHKGYKAFKEDLTTP